MKELDDAIYEQIRELCAGGDALADGEFYEEALASTGKPGRCCRRPRTIGMLPQIGRAHV